MAGFRSSIFLAVRAYHSASHKVQMNHGLPGTLLDILAHLVILIIRITCHSAHTRLHPQLIPNGVHGGNNLWVIWPIHAELP